MCDVIITKTQISGEIITDVKVFYNVNADNYYNLTYELVSNPRKIFGRRKGNIREM